MVRRTEEALGGVDILVHNAGIVQRAGFADLTEADWRRRLEVNLLGAVLCARAAVPALRRRGGGVIVNIASMRGLIDRGAPHYAVAKAGLIMLTRSLAVDLAPAIRVNAVAPGYVETRTQAHLTVAQRERLMDAIPVGRFAEPAEVAAPAVPWRWPWPRTGRSRWAGPSSPADPPGGLRGSSAGPGRPL